MSGEDWVYERANPGGHREQHQCHALSFAEGQGLQLSTDSEEVKVKLWALSGTSIEVVGTAVLPVTIGRWKFTIPFLATDARAAIIIGMPGLRDLDVKVDPRSKAFRGPIRPRCLLSACGGECAPACTPWSSQKN